MKKLGIVGGLGPMATAYFMRLIVEMTDAVKDQEHIEIILHSKPQIPDRSSYILGISRENPANSIIDVVGNLEINGADIIAIPCITAHFFQKEIEAKSTCPIINTIEESALYLKKEGIEHIGIMATDGTIKGKLFQNTLDSYGIKCELPDDTCQSMIMQMIYNNVKAGMPLKKDCIDRVVDKLFESGAQAILLGCTELSIYKRDYKMQPGILDALEVMARASVIHCGKLKREYTHLISV